MFCKNCGEERSGVDEYGLCAECSDFPSASGELLHELVSEVRLDGLNEPRAAKLADLGQVAVAQHLALHAEIARALSYIGALDEPDGDQGIYRLPVAEVRRIRELLENLGAPQGA